jgi:hypothetical protein
VGTNLSLSIHQCIMKKKRMSLKNKKKYKRRKMMKNLIQEMNLRIKLKIQVEKKRIKITIITFKELK